jgi:mannose-6-phosphate isomerase-like protein (cupin superfamily)
MRRVVTGVGGDGRSTVLVDEEVVDSYWTPLWGVVAPPVLPADGAPLTSTPAPPLGNPAGGSVMPGPGGVQIGTFMVPAGVAIEFPPDFDSPAHHLRAQGGGMHATDTVDICFVISGELTMTCEDGTVVVLRPGDWVVQQGAAHAWANRSSEPVTACVVIVGADRAG